MPKWTKEAIVNAIRESSVDGVCSSSAVGMTVATMARRAFGDFSSACTAAGVVSALSARKTYEVCQAPGCNLKPRSGASPWCEKHYMRMRRNGTLEPLIDTKSYDACAHCDKPSSNKYCSSRCAARASRGYSPLAICEICGDEFAPTNKGIDPNVCSSECAAERDRRYSRRYYRKRIKEDPEFRVSAKASSDRRRARKRNAFIEDVDPRVVYERDGWVCQICNGEVDPNLSWPDPMSASVDHIRPLSVGGKHCYDNVQLAHLGCNCKKGNRAA